jgi:hypothetical protein
MKKVIAELPRERVKSDLPWATQAVLWVHRGEEEGPLGLVIHLFHGCGTGGRHWNYCIPPQYVCNSCAAVAPSSVIEEKLLAMSKYAGYDPRNDRKAAVLATKNKRNM